MDLQETAKEIFNIASTKGFWEHGVTDSVIGSKIGLIHSEVSEWLEELRLDNRDSEAIEFEAADVVIRVLDLYEALRLARVVRNPLENVIQLKVQKNRERPFRHGKRF